MTAPADLDARLEALATRTMDTLFGDPMPSVERNVVRAALTEACALQREADAAVCEARAAMWRESNANPAKSTRARASEAESLAAAIRKAVQP